MRLGKIRTYSNWTLAILALIAATIINAFFVFVGAASIFSLSDWRWVFAAGVTYIYIQHDLEVNKSSILQAVKKWLDIKELKYTIAEREIKKCFAQEGYIKNPESSYNKCQFLQDYHKQEQYLNKLKQEGKIDINTLEKAKTNLRNMQKLFIKHILKSQPSESSMPSNSKYIDDLNALYTERRRKALRKELKTKTDVTAGFVPVIICANIIWGLATVFFVQKIIIILAGMFFVTAAALGPIALVVIPIATAILAAIGYTWSCYNAITNIIYNDTIQKLWKKIKQSMIRKPDESRLDHVGRVSSVIVISILLTTSAVIAIGVTAGTCIAALPKGAAICLHLLPQLCTILTQIPSWIQTLSLWASGLFVGASTVIWSLDNTLETLNKTKLSITKTVKNFFGKYVKQPMEKLNNRENIFQKLNPFRPVLFIIPRIYLASVFVLYIVITAFSSRIRLGDLSPETTASAYGASYALGNGHFFIDKKKNYSMEFTKLALFVPLVLVCFPIYIPAIVWQWGFSQLNHSKKPKEKLTFKQAILWCIKLVKAPMMIIQVAEYILSDDKPKKSHNREKITTYKRRTIDPDLDIAPNISANWHRQNCLHYLDEKIRRYRKKIDPTMGNDLSQKRVATLRELRSNIRNDDQYNMQKFKRFLNEQYKDPTNYRSTTTNSEILCNRNTFFSNSRNSKKQNSGEKIIKTLKTQHIPRFSSAPSA